MDFRQIKIVLTVAKYLSFSEASWQIVLSPSSVSKQVAAVEEELNVRLFDRKARSRVSLTPEGEALIPMLQQLETEHEALMQKAAELSDARKPSLHLGFPNGWSTLGEDEMLLGFHACHPQIRTEGFARGTAVDLLPYLNDGTLDVIISMSAPEQIEHFTANASIGAMELEKLQLHFGLSEHHPAIRNGCVDLADLKGETFFFRDSCHVHKENDVKIHYFTEACRKEGFSPKMEFVEMRNSMVFSQVAAGLGVIPLMYCPKISYPGVVVLPDKGSHYQFSRMLFYKKGNHSPALSAFLAYLRTAKPQPSAIEGSDHP